MEIKEERIRKITNLYYSNPKIQEAILKFGVGREVVPRYFEAFGKRPDMLIYPSDLNGAVKKGATSFHASEEIWIDPLKLNSELRREELNELRTGWDFLIDIDSKYLDLSKLLAKLVIKALEEHGVKNWKIKFSGSKGFHIIVSWMAFPEEFNGMKTKEMFPEWPKTICEYLMYYIKKEYNKKAGEVMGDFDIIKKRTNLSEEEFLESMCPICGREAKKGVLVILECPECKFSIKRKDIKMTKRKLVCPQNSCPGFLNVVGEEEYFQCEHCKDVSSVDKRESSGKYKTIFTKEAKSSEDFEEEIKGEIFGSPDLVLVAPRHLFRMPYSLHEKTALASVVLSKDEIENFDPLRDADPLRIEIRDFLPMNKLGEAMRLLMSALEWKKRILGEEEIQNVNKRNYEYKDLEIKGVSEEIFPNPIKKLLNGLKEGRKRGLFVLLTFLRSLNFSPDYINTKIREWNSKNEPPLKEGYVKSQIEWHLKQKRKILPPNYSNDNFYKDLGLLDEKPREKNPIVKVLREVRKNQ